MVFRMSFNKNNNRTAAPAAGGLLPAMTGVAPSSPAAATAETKTNDRRTSSASTASGSSTGSPVVDPVMYPAQIYDPEPAPEVLGAKLQALKDQGYSRGLTETLVRNTHDVPLRIWIVDNSGSMSKMDGHRLVDEFDDDSRDDDGGDGSNGRSSSREDIKFAKCSRWAEMQQTVEYHAQMAALLINPTIFRLLNDPGRACGQQQFTIAQRGEAFLGQEIAVARSTMMRCSPGGVTPLTDHVREIRASIAVRERQMRDDGTKKVAVIIATDGMPSNYHGASSPHIKKEFVDALKKLEGLPVSVVVRLCTDETNVVKYWNEISNELDIDIVILDDFVAEANSLCRYNRWFTYGLPIHRMREMGYKNPVFDIMKQRKLRKREVAEICNLVLGNAGIRGIVADPEKDWDYFVEGVHSLMNKEDKQWNPMTKKMESWINIDKLKKEYSSLGIVTGSMVEDVRTSTVEVVTMMKTFAMSAKSKVSNSDSKNKSIYQKGVFAKALG